MDLVNVEGVSLEGTVFDGPVFHRPNVRGDRRLLIGFKYLLLLSIHSDVELDGAVGTAKFLREIQFSLRSWLLLFQLRELDALHRSLGHRFGGADRWLCLRHLLFTAADLNPAQLLLEIRVASRAG